MREQANAFAVKSRSSKHSKHSRHRATAGQIFDVDGKRGSVIAAALSTEMARGAAKSTIIDLEKLE